MKHLLILTLSSCLTLAASAQEPELDKLEKRTTELESRLGRSTQMPSPLNSVERRLQAIEKKLSTLERDLEQLEARIKRLETQR